MSVHQKIKKTGNTHSPVSSGRVTGSRDAKTTRPPGKYGPITRTGIAAMGATVIGAGVVVAGAAMAVPLEIGVGLGTAAVGTSLKVYDTFRQRKK